MKEKLGILVTGASGLVGNSIVGELSEDERFEITGVCGKNKLDTEATLKKIFQLDISDYEALKVAEELEKIDIIIHAAGLAHQFGDTLKENFWRVNVVGTENVCKLAVNLNVKHFILISSVSVYGNYGNVEADETFKCHPDGFYAESKLEAEKIAVKLCESANINLTILRLATVIGEGDRGNVARLIDSINKGKFVWIGNGANKKSLIYKGDAAKAVSKIIENQPTGTQIFNVTAKAISMKEIVDAIAENLPKKLLPLSISTTILNLIFRLNKNTVSLNKVNEIEKTVEKWLANDIYSGEKMLKIYNFNPATIIAEAIEKEVNSYKKSIR
jgi:nucleoside-diphosphate-sugar epimerase